jgi:hypothetical protein
VLETNILGDLAVPGSTRRVRAWHFFAGVIFLAGYAALILYFVSVDVYDDHFFDRQYGPIYNLLRAVFGFYLFIILYTSGDDILCLFRRWRGLAPNLSCGEKVVVYFFTGAAAWQFFMFALGYLSLYTRSVAIAVTIPVVLHAAVKFGNFLQETSSAFVARLQSYGPRARFTAAILFVALLVAAFLLAIVKGLYPAGGHDYYTHYFYYYVVCLKNRGIWPNDVWYHYFYSKGEGIFFLAMLLTDPLAPSIVTYGFTIVATVALFLMIDRMRPRSFWPWAASICWLLLLIYAGGQSGLHVDNSNYWAEFQKEHEINAAFMLVFIWLCDGMLRDRKTEHSLFFWLAAVSAFAVAYVEQPTPIIIGIFCAVAMIALLVRRRARLSMKFLLLACSAGAGMISNLVINYLTTGIPSDVFINIFWPIINLRKVESVGWLWPVIVHSRDLANVDDELRRLTLENFVHFPGFLHTAIIQAWLGYFQGMLFAAGTFAILVVKRRWIPADLRSPLFLIGCLLIAFLISAVLLGTSFPDSFYRYSSFIVPGEFIAGAMVWLAIASFVTQSWVSQLISLGLPIVATGFFVNQLWQLQGDHLRAVIHDGARFASGRYSIYDAYTNQAEWPSRMPFGAIYPGSLAVWELFSSDARPRVWTFHVHAYCMLPGCVWESDKSFPTSPRMFDVVFGPLDQAKQILQREGMNYFLLSRDLQVGDESAGIGLLSPEHIGDYLGIKWTDGTTDLLTWLGPGIQPLTAEWLAHYRQQVSKSGEAASLRSNELIYRTVYERLKSDPKWGYQLQLPWLQ